MLTWNTEPVIEISIMMGANKFTMKKTLDSGIKDAYSFKWNLEHKVQVENGDKVLLQIYDSRFELVNAMIEGASALESVLLPVLSL
jgi:hypothetical protein